MRLLTAVSLASLLLTPLAYADTTFYFSGYAPANYTENYSGINVVGSFTALPVAGITGEYYVTSVKGSVNGQAITGLVYDPNIYSGGAPPASITGNQENSADGFLYDDLFFSSSYQPGANSPTYAVADGFDYWGLLFQTATMYVNLFTDTSINPPHALGPVYADTNNAYANGIEFKEIADPGADSVIATTKVASLAPAPEPSSLVLLGTGVLGAATMVRRKVRHQTA